MKNPDLSILSTLDPAATVVETVPKLALYQLPGDVLNDLLRVANEANVLIVGETHGTEEVPRVVAALLPELSQLGYGALALEVPADAQEAIGAWGQNVSAPVPPFFALPDFDGRGNAHALGLAVVAVASGWRVLCFDCGLGQLCGPHWSDRDKTMAHNLREQRDRLCSGTKVIAVCGNMHSRIANAAPADDWRRDLWPSFAAVLQAEGPHLAVRSVNVVFHSGTFYNCSVRQGGDGNVPPAPFVAPGRDGEHTLDLHLPESTAASFLHTPRAVPLPE